MIWCHSLLLQPLVRVNALCEYGGAGGIRWALQRNAVQAAKHDLVPQAAVAAVSACELFVQVPRVGGEG